MPQPDDVPMIVDRCGRVPIGGAHWPLIIVNDDQAVDEPVEEPVEEPVDEPMGHPDGDSQYDGSEDAASWLAILEDGHGEPNVDEATILQRAQDSLMAIVMSDDMEMLAAIANSDVD